MKRENITEAVGMIDDRYIAEAAEFKAAPSRRGRRIGIAAAAACLAAGIAVGAYALARNKPTAEVSDPDSSTVRSDGILPRPYQNRLYTPAEGAIIWPWEYLTEIEKYSSVSLGGRKYRVTSHDPLDESCIGRSLGKCEASGFDEYTEKTYTREYEAFEIKDTSPARSAAVRTDSGCYAVSAEEYDPPKTLGELFSDYGLADKLILAEFSEYEGFEEKGHYTAADGAAVVRKLSECTDARLQEKDQIDRTGRKVLEFRADIPRLGVRNKALYISDDGMIMTNAFNWGYVYDIGTARAAELIALAEKDAKPSDEEGYNTVNMIGGKVTEIAEGYIKIDDSELCDDPSDGKVFTLPTDDIRIRRVIEFPHRLKLGDTVAVLFNEGIDESLTIRGAGELSHAVFTDGDIYIPE